MSDTELKKSEKRTDLRGTHCTPTPCDQCPWRVENHGKRHRFGFFTKSNRQRLWNQIRQHHEHVACGAKGVKGGAMECMGSVVLVTRELLKLKELTNGGPIQPEHLDQYLKESKNDKGLTREGLYYFAIARQMGRPLGDGLLAQPGADLLNADWIGR